MTKGSRVLATFSLFVSLTAFSQVDPQISVKEFKDLRDEARSMIKGFDLSKDIGSVGAPDYRFVRERMRSILDQKPAELERFLISFNNEISDDYNIIQSVKELGKGKAIKQTADVAKRRFEDKARGFQGSYQNALLSFVEKDLVGLEKECLTVLCVNQVREDLKAWFKQAKKMNKPLKLDGVTLARSGDVNKRTANHIKAAASPSVISGKPIAFQRESNEFKALTDSRLNDELLSFYSLPEVQKLTSAQLDRYQNGKIPASLKERYGLKTILALSDAGFKNLMDPLMTQKDFETFKLEDIASKGLIALRRANEKCYEVSKVNDFELNTLSTVVKSSRSNFKEMKLKNGRTLSFDGQNIHVKDGNKTFWSKKVGALKAKPTELRNGNIAVPYENGVWLFNPNGEKIVDEYGGFDYYASEAIETPKGNIVVGNEKGRLLFLNSRGKVIARGDIGANTAIRWDAIKLENGKVIVEDLDGNKGVFTEDGKREYIQSKKAASVKPVRLSDAGQAEFEKNKIKFLDPQGKVIAEHKGLGNYDGNAVILQNGVMVVGSDKGVLEVFDGISRVKTTQFMTGVKGIRELSPNKVEVDTFGGTFIFDVRLLPNKKEVVVQVACSEEQLRDLTIPRRTEKGAKRQ